MFWQQYGKSGRSSNPTSQHHCTSTLLMAINVSLSWRPESPMRMCVWLYSIWTSSELLQVTRQCILTHALGRSAACCRRQATQPQNQLVHACACACYCLRLALRRPHQHQRQHLYRGRGSCRCCCTRPHETRAALPFRGAACSSNGNCHCPGWCGRLRINLRQ